ncbi:MAG: NAD(P)/FAD-dependent oxidoreductase [Pseudomonadota bacterium]
MRRWAHPAAGFEESWYYATARGLVDHPPLQGRVEADVCVVGGGYTGLSAALELAERGYSVVLLESYRVGAGASGRSGGVLGTGQRRDQDELEAWLGPEAAAALWRISVEATALVRERIRRFDIACDLRDGVLHAAHRRRYASAYWRYVDHLASRYEYRQTRKVDAAEMADMLGTDVYHGGYLDTGGGHLHPLNLALGLARACRERGVRIFEHSPVRTHRQQRPAGAPGRVTATTAGGTVSASYLVLACNGYLGRLAGAIEAFQMPINNFMLATEPLGENRARRLNRDDVAVVDSRFVVNYFRMSPDHRLIFGGGENYTPWFPKDLKRFVRRFMLVAYPGLTDVAVDYAWGGTLAITLKRMPHFGRDGNVFWAHGYSGHGVAMANMGGKLIAEAMAGTAERFDLFADLPHARFPGGRYLRWPALAVGMLYYAMLDRF